jgi:hypothetical protein
MCMLQKITASIHNVCAANRLHTKFSPRCTLYSSDCSTNNYSIALQDFSRLPYNITYRITIFVLRNTVRYGSLNTIVAQPKNCPFGANTTIELKNVIARSGNTCALVSWNVPH